jgi:hypothetical protein
MNGWSRMYLQRVIPMGLACALALLLGGNVVPAQERPDHQDRPNQDQPDQIRDNQEGSDDARIRRALKDRGPSRRPQKRGNDEQRPPGREGTRDAPH